MNLNLNRPVFLCGMMGTGKSVIGKSIAKKLHLPFTDLDSLIEAETGKSIPQLFKEFGEPEFRKIEKKTLIKYLDQLNSKSVLALGGGTLQNQQLVDLIKNSGILIYIVTPQEILLHRLKKSKRRPMISGLNTAELKSLIHKLLEERIPYYNQAHLIVSGTANKPEITTELIIKELKLYND